MPDEPDAEFARLMAEAVEAELAWEEATRRGAETYWTFIDACRSQRGQECQSTFLAAVEQARAAREEGAA